MSSHLRAPGPEVPELKPSRDLNVINARLADLRKRSVHLIGPGVGSLMKMETLPAGYEVAWHCFMLDPREENGPHVYRDNRWRKGQVALKREALLEFWASADGRYVHSQREDDRRDPHLCTYTWAGSVLGISGMIVGPTALTKQVDLRDGSEEIAGMKPGQISQQRANIVQLAEAKAHNRVIRALLGISQTYTAEEAAWPFVLMKLVFVPDMTDPMIRLVVTAHALGATAQLFGGTGGGELIRQLLSARVERDEEESQHRRAIAAVPQQRQLNEPIGELRDEAVAHEADKTEQTALPDARNISESSYVSPGELPFAVPDTAKKGIFSIQDYEMLEAACTAKNGSPSEEMIAALEELRVRCNWAAPITKPFKDWLPVHRKQFVELLLKSSAKFSRESDQGGTK